MKRHIPIRLAACAALAGSALLTAVALPGGIAAASTATVTCTHQTGTETAQSLSGCTGAGVNATNATATGKQTVAGETHTSTSASVVYEVTWTNHKVSVIESKVGISNTKANLAKCPKETGETVADYITNAGTVESSVKVSGKTLTSTTTGLVGQSASGVSCIYENSKKAVNLVENVGSVKL